MTQDDVKMAPNATGTPHLRRTAAGAQLVIDGTPRLLLAGQAHNSSPSSEQYFTAVCEHVAKMNVQTLLVGISWSSTEPVEGTDDFTILDTLLTQARAHQLRLVLCGSVLSRTPAPRTPRPGYGPTPLDSPEPWCTPQDVRCSPTTKRCRNRCCRCSHRSCDRWNSGPSARCCSTSNAKTPTTPL